MTIDPSVSVVLPAFNADSTIVEAVSSVLRQSHQSLEILVCDDSSTDDTREAVARLGDTRIRLLVNESNLGPGPSRDRAIDAARAPWIALIDADDAWHPQRLERLLQAALLTGSDVVFDDILLCHDRRDALIPWRPLHGRAAFGGTGSLPRQIRFEDYLTAPRLLVQPMLRTDFVRANGCRHGSGRFAEDAEFYLRLGLKGARFCYLPEPLYYYRVTPDSLTAQSRDPSLMRQLLELCAQWEGWTPSAQQAFATKIEALRRNEALYALADELRKGRVRAALGLLFDEPYLVPAALRKAFTRIGYELHRNLRGGRTR